MKGPYVDAVKESRQVVMTCHIRQQKEALLRMKLGLFCLKLCRWITGWQMEISFVSPGDQTSRAAKRRAGRRNSKWQSR